MEKVQKRAVAMVTGLAARDYEERLREMGMVTLAERRHQSDMAQVHKILTGKDRVQRETRFEMARTGERTTRATDDPLNIKFPAARLEVRRNFFSHRVAKSWNQIPAELKNAKTTKEFKNGYKKLRSERVRMEDV